MTFAEEIEAKKDLFSNKESHEDMAKHIFDSKGSHGNNNERLAKLLVTWDFCMGLLKWNDVKLTDIVTDYQASVNTKYHNDYKAIKTIEELDKKLALRRMQAQQNMPSIV